MSDSVEKKLTKAITAVRKKYGSIAKFHEVMRKAERDAEPLEMSSFKRGRIARHKHSGNSYVVDANYGNRATATRTVEITNPEEWEIVG